MLRCRGGWVRDAWFEGLSVAPIGFGEGPRFDAELDEHHWLGHRMVGEVMRYVATDAAGEWIALMPDCRPESSDLCLLDGTGTGTIPITHRCLRTRSESALIVGGGEDVDEPVAGLEDQLSRADEIAPLDEGVGGVRVIADEIEVLLVLAVGQGG